MILADSNIVIYAAKGIYPELHTETKAPHLRMRCGAFLCGSA
jgi:hypothetical protein